MESVVEEEAISTLDLSGRDLSVSGASEMRVLGEKYATVTQLTLQNCQLTFLENIVYFGALERLDLSRNLLTSLDHEKNEVLFFLKNLVQLNLAYNYLTALPELIFNLAKLTVLNVSNNNLAIICDEIGLLENLTDLDISFNQLAFLPDTLIKLTKLNKVKINSNELKELPAFAPSLVFLNLNDNLLKQLPPSIGILTNLRKLYADNNELLEVPQEIGKLVALRELNLNYNQLIDLPSSLGNLTELTILDLSDNLFEAKEWYDPEIPNLLKFIRTKTFKPSRNGKFKSKKRRQDTLRLLPTQRKAGSSARPKLQMDGGSDSNSVTTPGQSPSSVANNANNAKNTKRKSIPGAVKPVSNVFLKLYRLKCVDGVKIGDIPSIVMIDRVICDYHVLNAGDVFLLDSPDAFWIWIGPTSHPSELLKAKYMAQKLNEEFGANLPVHVLDGKTMLSWESAGEFWLNLGVLNESDVKSFVKLLKDAKALAKAKATVGGDGKALGSAAGKRGSSLSDAFLFSLAPPSGDKEALAFRIEEAKIYKFAESEEEGRVNIQIVSAGEPPVKSILDSSSCFLFDMPFNPSVYIWAGTYASSEAKSWAILKAEEIINRDSIDFGIERSLAWNMDDAETWDFKELFFDWLDTAWDPAERDRIQAQLEAQEKLLREIEAENLDVINSVKISRQSAIDTPSPGMSPSPSDSDITPYTGPISPKNSNASIKDSPVTDAVVSPNSTPRKTSKQRALEVEQREAQRLEMERLEQQLVDKRRKQAQEAAAAAAEEARRQADERRAQAQREAAEAEKKRQLERDRAAKAAADVKAAADAKAAAEASKKALDAKAAAESASKAQKAAEDAKLREKAEFEAAASLMSPPPSSRATPATLIKQVTLAIDADAKQAATINKLWRAPTLDRARLSMSPTSKSGAKSAELVDYSGVENHLGDLTETRGTLLAAPRRAIGPQGRRAATQQGAKQIEVKAETSAQPRLAVGGAFGLLRAVGGEAALAQRKEKTAASSSAESPDAQVWQKGMPRLIWIKGRRKILLRLVPVSPASLNSGDVFILDNGKGLLYQWNGKDANRIAKGKAMDLAKNIKDKEYSGTAKVVVLEEGKTDTNINDQFWKTMHGHVPNETPSADLPPLPASYEALPIKSAAEGGDDAEAEVALKGASDLYKLVFNSKKEKVEPELVAGYPLKKDLLQAEECYILDAMSEIYVWCGKNSPIKTRKQSLDVAIKLMRSRNEYWVAPVIRELPGGESVMFREKFSDWGYGPPIQMQKIAVGKNVAKTGDTMANIDVEALFNQTITRQEVMVDTTGQGEVHVWRIVDFKKVAVDPKQIGHFWAGDTYIILYKYKVGNREAFLVYYWQGRTATINEKGTSALLTIELDKEFKANGTAKEVRVVQNQEPKHFLLVFRHRYIVHSGKYIDHPLQTCTPKNRPASVYELCGSTEENVRLIQVPASRVAFKSTANFLVLAAGAKSLQTWQGQFSSDFFASSLAPFSEALASAYEVELPAKPIKEGSEPTSFWSALADSREQYPKLKRAPCASPRLFHASEASGQFRVQEIPAPFSREDLTRNDCYLLDAGDTLYMWQNRANPSETKRTLETAVRYYVVAAQARALPTSPIPLHMVTSGHEPRVFTAWFMAWTEFDAPNNLDGHLASGTEYLAQFETKYSFEDLVQKKYPPGVDTTRLEDLLDDAEFERAFDMDRTAFAALPGWQAQKIKRAKGLF